MSNSSLDYEKISNIINNVDIIKIQNSSEDIDTFKPDDIVKSSGVKYLNEVIQNILGEYSDKYFFEYALLPSTLDPDKEKLYSMSAVQDNSVNAKGNSNSFLSLIEKNVKNIIDHLFEKHHELNFFHNPETFLAPSQINILHSFSDQLDDNADTRNSLKLEIFKGKSWPQIVPNEYISAEKGLYLSNMTYDRRFDDIISSAKIIFDENETREKLLKQYEHGATDLRYFYDKIVNINNEKACYITLPLLSSSSEGFPEMYKKVFGNKLENRRQGIGVFFLYFYVKSNYEKLKTEKEINRIEQELFIEINNLIRVFTYNYVFNIGLRLAERAKENSIKSAIAAVMSRNMSHNLGSHVFYYTRQELLNLYEKEKENKDFKYSQEIKGLAWFLHYVQERQDFIANINSNDKYPFGPLNLKQDVIDEMTPDAVDVRHNSSPQTKNFLLENIVRSENIKRRETGAVDDLLKNIDLKIILKNEAKSVDQKNATNYIFSTWIAKDVTNFYEIDLAVNCGQQSRHAFLILLENIIRNSAKHGFSPFDNKDLLVSIEIESNKEQYQITIYDNACNAYDLKEISTKEGVRKISNLENLQQNLRGIRMLDKDYLSINRDNKGLKEILISILWMKGYELNQIESYAKNENVLSIIDVKNENDNNIANIGYRFSLPKFKDLVELSDNDIIALLQDNLIVKFGSIYSVKDNAIERALKNEYIKTKFEDSVNVKMALSKRIPRILFNDDGVTNSYRQLYQSKYNDFQNHIISFDRLKSKTIDSLKDIVKLTIPNDSNAKIQFVNHLSKSEENLKEHISLNKLQRINHYRKPDVILESISGANQIFNLFQKFQANNYANTNSIIENKLHDLYWNILDAYNTVIFIVDERLSYKNDGMSFDSYIVDLLDAKIDVGTFITVCFSKQPMYYEGRLNEIINLKESKQIKGKKIIELLDEACSEKDTSDLCLHSNLFEAKIKHIPFLPQNIKEKFLQQQNTYLFNLNTDHKLINSLGEYDSGSITEIDFFSIHIGLLDKMPGTDMINKIREVLKTNKIEPRFISVHSGRGGLNSKEEKITFLPFSVLQRCLEDSKFVLSEFFNNYKYIPFN